MRTVLRRLLLLLMMLALPLQGLASASMVGCALAAPAPAPAVAMADAGMSGCHESEPRSDAPPSQHSCGHCAACFAGSLPLIPAFETAFAPPPAQLAIAGPVARYAGHIPEGPERPPRTFRP